MQGESKFTNEYKKNYCKNPIPFPHIVLDKKISLFSYSLWVPCTTGSETNYERTFS